MHDRVHSSGGGPAGGTGPMKHAIEVRVRGPFTERSLSLNVPLRSTRQAIRAR